jgi:ubiquinone/menaquinone biosynthesis C-methylase UbiE
MRRPEFIARQSRCPTGLLGRLIGRIMETETATANEHALELLRLTAADRVLEVGFGHGRTIELAADRAARGFVAGTDISEQMLRMASRRNRHHIAARRVLLQVSDGNPLPFPESSFDKVYAVHVVYFWPEPRDQLREISRVLKPAGRFVLGFRPRGDERTADFPSSVYRFHEADEVERLLADCGFQVTTKELSPDRTVLVVAVPTSP